MQAKDLKSGECLLVNNSTTIKYVILLKGNFILIDKDNKLVERVYISTIDYQGELVEKGMSIMIRI